MADISTYPISFGYKAQDGYYYGPNGTIGPYHRGSDRAAPTGTPIIVGGVTIGTVGTTGASSGPHLHTQLSPEGEPAGKEFNYTGTVIATGKTSVEGNYVKIQGSDGIVRMYFHLSQILVSNGQKIGGSVLDDKDITAMYLAAGAVVSEATKPENLNFWRGKKPESLANELYKGNELFRYKGSNYDKDVNLQSTDVDIMRILVTEIEGWDYDSTHGGQSDATLKKNLSGNPVKSVVRNMFANQTSQDYRKAKKAAFAGDADPKVLINGQEYIKK